MQTAGNYRISLIWALLLSCLAIPGFGQTNGPVIGEISKCWFYAFGESSSVVSVSADSQQVYLAMSGGKLEAVTPDGRKVWSADLGGSISSNALPTGNSVVLVTSALGGNGGEKHEATVRSLSKETGITLWTARIAEAELHHLSAYNGWIAVVSNNGSILALDANGGKAVWRREIASGFVGRPAFSGSKVAVASSSNQIFVLSLSGGEIDEIYKTALPAGSLSWSTEGAVIAGDERGSITSFTIGSEKQNWRFKSGGQIPFLIDVGSDLVAVSYENFVYSLSERNGGLNWKRRMSGRVSHIAHIGGSTFWLSALDDNGLIVLDSRNGKVLSQVSFGSDEKLAAEPVISGSIVVVATNRGAYGLSTIGCGNGKEGESAKIKQPLTLQK